MFPDLKIAKYFACSCTKCTAIIKQAVAPYYIAKKSMVYPFPVLMDESNDKSCIILVRVLDCETADVHTRFVYMPVVNIGTARNLFHALSESLSKLGLDFSQAISFMSNVMKGARSGGAKTH